MPAPKDTVQKSRVLDGEKPVIISISGDLGSGKSVLTTALVDHWQADRYSTGMVQRKIADKMGITTLELNKRAETDRSIDEQIDSVFINLARTPKNLVVDSRMAFHFLPMSFRIKLEVHPAVAAARIQNDTSRIGEGKYTSIEDIEAAIMARKASERERFKAYYNADIEDHAGYDLVINTTDVPPHAVSQLVNDAITLWRRGIKPEKMWLSPRHVFPHVDPALVDESAIERAKLNWPLTGQWADGAVKGQKAGQLYAITDGAEWVSAGLRTGKDLMPVFAQGGAGTMPDAGVTERWEKAHNFKHVLAG